MKYAVGILLLLPMLCSLVQAAEQPQRSKFVMSHIIREGIQPYVDFIDAVYTELGFEVVLVPTPNRRGVLLLNEGLFDADVVRVDFDLTGMDNLIKVTPALNNAYVALLCVKFVPCAADVLLQPNVAIATNSVVHSMFNADQLRANIVDVNQAQSLPGLLKAKRISYGLLLIDESAAYNMSENFNIVRLKDSSVFHIVHKKHQALLPQIEAKLREKLPAFIASRQKGLSSD